MTWIWRNFSSWYHWSSIFFSPHNYFILFYVISSKKKWHGDLSWKKGYCENNFKNYYSVRFLFLLYSFHSTWIYHSVFHIVLFVCLFVCFVLFLRFYLFIWQRQTAREGTQAGGLREGEVGFPLSREPNAGLDPRTLGTWPELKADA